MGQAPYCIKPQGFWTYALREAMHCWYGLMKTLAKGVFGTGINFPRTARGQLRQENSMIKNKQKCKYNNEGYKLKMTLILEDFLSFFY